MKSIFFGLLMFGTNTFAQTHLFQQEGRGELESPSFTIERPATLVISCKTDSGKIEEFGQTSVQLKKDVGDAIETEEMWILDLSVIKAAKDKKSYRVRVVPGKYFINVDCVGDVSWDIRLVHDPQVDRFSFRKDAQSFVIESNGQQVATAVSKELAETITNLLNARSQ